MLRSMRAAEDGRECARTQPRVEMNVAPAHGRRVAVFPGRDHLCVRGVGAHVVEALADAFAPRRDRDDSDAIEAFKEAIMRANGLRSDALEWSREIRIPVPARGASLRLMVAAAVQKAAAHGPTCLDPDLDFSRMDLRENRGTLLVEVRRRRSGGIAAYLLRRIPSAPGRQIFEVRGLNVS